MQRLTMLALMVICVSTQSAVVSATALGSIELLNKNGITSAFSFTGKSKKNTELAILGSNTRVICEETATEGELEATGKLGPFHLHFEKCKTSAGGSCTGLGDAAGTILALGTLHLATAFLDLTVGLIEFLVSHLHFECTVLFVKKLVLVLGDYLCKITPINVLTTTATVNCLRGAENGDPWLVKYENDKGEDVELANPLKASETDATEEMSSELGEGEVTITPEVKLDV